jgi:serine/threonine protein phosphatase PrpC
MGCALSKPEITLTRPFRRAQVNGGPPWPAYYHDDESRLAQDLNTAHLTARRRSVSRSGMALQRGGSAVTFTDLELESGHAQAETPTVSALKILQLASVNMVGFDPENPMKNNQDAAYGDAMFTAPNTGFFVVADGHGENGHVCSNYVIKKLAAQLQQVLRDSPDFRMMASSAAPSSTKACVEVDKCIKYAFLAVNKALLASETDTTLSGSTCCVALLAGNKLITANVGDSRCIGAYAEQQDGQLKLVARVLTIDHKPDLPKEKARILASGGRVAPWAEAGLDDIFRVWLKSEETPGLGARRPPRPPESRALAGTLAQAPLASHAGTRRDFARPTRLLSSNVLWAAMSRSFGDKIAASVGIIAEPEIAHYVIEEGLAFVLLASDGVWEFMSDQDVVDSIWAVRMRGLSFHKAVDAVACKSTRAHPSSLRKLPGRGLRDLLFPTSNNQHARVHILCGPLAPLAGLRFVGSAHWMSNEGSADDISIIALSFDSRL